MAEYSFHDGDNFIRNMVTVRGCGWAPAIIARKLTTMEELPVSIDDLVLDLRVDSDEEDETLARMERGAAAWLERRTGYVVSPGTYQVDLAGWWPDVAEVMRGPLRQLDSVSYLDAAGASVDADLSQFWVQEEDRSFTVKALSSFTRPPLWSEVQRVRLTFSAGFRLPSETAPGLVALEDGLRTILIMMTGHLYKNRELFAAGKLEALDDYGRTLLGTYRQFW